MREDRDRLRDILDAIKNIERHAKRGRRVFEEDELAHTCSVLFWDSVKQMNGSGIAQA